MFRIAGARLAQGISIMHPLVVRASLASAVSASKSTKLAKPLTAFLRFAKNETRVTGSSLTERSTEAGRLWRALSDGERQKYLDAYRQEKLEYDQQLAAHRKTLDYRPRKTQPLSLFVQEHCTAEKPLAEVVKVWTTLSEAEKEKYISKAAKENEGFDDKLKAWKERNAEDLAKLEKMRLAYGPLTLNEFLAKLKRGAGPDHLVREVRDLIDQRKSALIDLKEHTKETQKVLRSKLHQPTRRAKRVSGKDLVTLSNISNLLRADIEAYRYEHNAFSRLRLRRLARRHGLDHLM